MPTFATIDGGLVGTVILRLPSSSGEVTQYCVIGVAQSQMLIRKPSRSVFVR
jgi:hypothetical protein